MGPTTSHSTVGAQAWLLAGRQHGVVARRQLVALGFTRDAIRHRLESGRLHRVYRGVYAVGRPGLPQRGLWMAAVLACGDGAVLSHESAAALWAVRPARNGSPTVSVPQSSGGRVAGVAVRRRIAPVLERSTRRDGIPLTSVPDTLVDLAASIGGGSGLEAAIGEADRLGLIDPERLRGALDQAESRPGAGVLRATLDRHTFVLTDSELERRFLPLAARAGLGTPRTGCLVEGFRADFFWPELGLVVETDGLRYHRTAAQQAKDRRRDQRQIAAGLTALRFTHAQVRFEPRHVVATLGRVARRLAAPAPHTSSGQRPWRA